MNRRYLLICIVVSLVAAAVVLPGTEDAKATWWSLLPPLVAIALALVLRDVLLSLFLGVWLGASMLAGGNLGAGFLRVVDTHVREVLTDPDKISIVIFSVLLGGMVGVMSRCGGTHGIVRALEPFATTPRRTQVVTWLMGMLVFFDDYSNTLLVGNAMRPVTDRHQVSREKLAYLVDSTAAPVACVALVSTWIGYQVSLLGDALTKSGSDLNPFKVFLASIPYAFYPLFALALTAIVAFSGRDWGPMLAAERRARKGQVLGPSAQPLADYDSAGLAPHPDAPRRWVNAAVPVLLVLVVTLGGLYVTGRDALIEAGSSDLSLSNVIGKSDPFTVLLWACLIGLTAAILLAVGQQILTLRESLDAAVGGFKSMLMAFVVLTLAWALGQVCTGLGSADYLKGLVEETLPPGMIPVVVFLVAAAVSFATGTSWGTLAILTPLAVPLALIPGQTVPELIPATVAAILGGSVFGDHCSPISDTTILSSMASGCDHVDHVRTQLPYAFLGAAVAMLVGYLPVALGVTPWLLLPLGLALLTGWVFFLGQPTTDPVQEGPDGDSGLD